MTHLIFISVLWWLVHLGASSQLHEYEKVVVGLANATSIYATPAGEVFIVEQQKNRLLKLSHTGQRVDSLGSIGFGDYQLDAPMAVDATNGLKVYVSDYNNRRIQVYDRRMQFLTSIKTKNPMFDAGDLRPTVLTVNAFGELFFYDEATVAIVKYNRQGRYEQSISLAKSEMSMPVQALKSTSDRLYVVDDARNYVYIRNSMGGEIGFIGPLDNIISLTMDEHHVWLLLEKQLIKATLTGRILDEITLAVPKTCLDMVWVKENLWLLTPTEVYKVPSHQLKR